jgi:hypothetical protein
MARRRRSGGSGPRCATAAAGAVAHLSNGPRSPLLAAVVAVHEEFFHTHPAIEREPRPQVGGDTFPRDRAQQHAALEQGAGGVGVGGAAVRGEGEGAWFNYGAFRRCPRYSCELRLEFCM